MSYFALQQFFGSPKNSDRRTYDTKMSAILPVTKVKPAAMARWLRAKPGSWILLSICRPQGGTKKTGCIILYFKMKHWSKERQNKNQDSSDIWCLVPVLLEGNPFRQDEEVEHRNRTKRKETAGRQQLQNQRTTTQMSKHHDSWKACSGDQGWHFSSAVCLSFSDWPCVLS